ncbi:MAG TPA: porin [Vicinamibacteria bacterium]
MLALSAASPVHAQGTSDALLRLLRILRDRGSITSEEYEDLRLAAGGVAPVPSPGPSPAAPPPLPGDATGAPAAVLVSTEALTARVQALETQVATDQSDLVKKALANKWYERIGLRGYTQFRFSEVDQGEGPDLEVPADRSVNASETLMIRRGRFIFSGDVTDHLYLYAQSDFNASTGATDFSLQMRDLYADVALDQQKAWRVRLGQSKVPFGWVNLQSSQNRAPLERPEALNGAVEGERDLGAYLMWAPPEARRRFRDLVSQGLKGSGDYGVVSAGLYSGQGLNRPDQNGDPHVMARVSYPFKFGSGQFFEAGAQGYYGRFVTQTQAINPGTGSITPTRPDEGVVDERVALTAVWYPQPFGFETEWTVGRGPELSDDLTRVESRPLHGGYVQFNYRQATGGSSLFPFVRWQYYDGGRKFARNAPSMTVNEMDVGVEFARWAELELTMIYTRTFERTRTSLFPYAASRGANRIGFQAQWNY